MTQLIDMTGQRYNRLLVQCRNNSAVRVAWWCICDCGNKLSVLADHLRRGNTQSCGCLNKELLLQRIVNMTKHECRACKQPTEDRSVDGVLLCSSICKTLYQRWCGMKNRCNNSNHADYSCYGAKGIQVCPEWNGFDTFFNWATHNGFQLGLEIDRINNNLGYSPSNCRWVTDIEQRRNQQRYIQAHGLQKEADL